MDYIHDVILRSLSNEGEEGQDAQRFVELWKSSGRLLDRVYLGDERGLLPRDIAEHVRPFWPSFPNVGNGERILIGHFEIPNPLKYNALFWRLPEHPICT